MKAWEDICLKCGLCCHSKWKTGPRTYVLDLSQPCPHLEKPENTCGIYLARFKAKCGCRKMTLLRAMTAPWLPPSCAYVAWAKRHHIRLVRDREWVYSDGPSS